MEIYESRIRTRNPNTQLKTRGHRSRQTAVIRTEKTQDAAPKFCIRNAMSVGYRVLGAPVPFICRYTWSSAAK